MDFMLNPVRLRKRSRGISIIEVLTAIVVAAIGVFGVFALIPFAIRQAEIGMNEEAAITLARNGMSDFEAQGYTSAARWAVPDFDDLNPAANFLPAFSPPGAASPPAPYSLPANVYCIDPWGWTSKVNGLVPPVSYVQPPALPATDVDFRVAPYFIPAGGNPFPRIRRITLFDNQQDVFSRGLARRLFAGPDDVVLEGQKNPATDLRYPNQTYFIVGGDPGPRQYEGRISWMMFAVLPPGISDQCRFYSVVSAGRNPELQDRVFQILMPNTNNDPGIPQFGGGDLRIREIAGSIPPADFSIRRGSWIMLLTTNGNMTDPVVQDISFCRVLEADLDTLVGNEFDVTLQGNDFFLTRNPIQLGESTMFAVLLPDVLAVYERSMRFPSLSDWN